MEYHYDDCTPVMIIFKRPLAPFFETRNARPIFQSLRGFQRSVVFHIQALSGCFAVEVVIGVAVARSPFRAFNCSSRFCLIFSLNAW